MPDLVAALDVLDFWFDLDLDSQQAAARAGEGS
jgi:hypothetical protein